MKHVNKSSFFHTISLVFLFVGITFQIGFSQNIRKPSSEEYDSLGAKSFAAKYMRKKEWKKYDWKSAIIYRVKDTGNVMFIKIFHSSPKDNELKYLMAYCVDNQITELVEHDILFTDTSTKLNPSFISSTSFICKSVAKFELQANQKEKGNFISKGNCADCGKKLAWVISGVYKNGKVENVPPTLYVLAQGALTAVPPSCTPSFAKQKDWIVTWGDFFNPFHKTKTD